MVQRRIPLLLRFLEESDSDVVESAPLPVAKDALSLFLLKERYHWSRIWWIFIIEIGWNPQDLGMVGHIRPGCGGLSHHSIWVIVEHIEVGGGGKEGLSRLLRQLLFWFHFVTANLSQIVRFDSSIQCSRSSIRETFRCFISKNGSTYINSAGFIKFEQLTALFIHSPVEMVFARRRKIRRIGASLSIQGFSKAVVKPAFFIFWLTICNQNIGVIVI